MALLFVSDVEAWDEASGFVSFAAEDAGTRAPIACGITKEALIVVFGAAAGVPELIQTFRQNREHIERVASLKYDQHGRRGPVLLRPLDFLGRKSPPTIH